MDAYIERIQKTFRDYGRIDPAVRGMGTTWTSAYLMLPHAVIVNVGDSRAYLFRTDELTQLTRDQTVAQQMIDAGISAEDVVKFRHLLTSGLGGDTESAQPEVLHLELRHGDRLLLCSDGLSDMVEDNQIAAGLREADPQTACDQLVEAALQAGGKDNITVVIADVCRA